MVVGEVRQHPFTAAAVTTRDITREGSTAFGVPVIANSSSGR